MSLIPKVYAQIQQFNDPSGDSPATLKDVEVVFNNIVQVAAYLAGLVAFIYLVIGGFRYLNAGGDPKAAGQAKQTITYAIFGLVGVLGAWIILRLIQVGTGVDVTNFKITVNQ